MSAVAAPTAPATPAVGEPGRAVTAHLVRELRRGTLVVAALLALLPPVVVVQYRETVGGELGAGALQVLATNPAIRTLFGPAVALDDPGGFTVWRTGLMTTVLVAVWALLSTVRVTRGEEDAGRWALLRAGTLPARSLLLRVAAVALAAQAVVGAALAAGLLVVGTEPAGALLHGAGTALTGAAFVMLGLACAQVLPDRRSAAGAGGAVLAVAFMARMVADGSEPFGWLRWLSPFGVLGQVRPYAADDPVPLLVLAGMALLPAVLAFVAVERRDVGAGLVRVPDERAPRTALLGSSTGFAVRRGARGWAAWTAGVAAYYLLVGLLTVSLTGFLGDNPQFASAAAEAGFTGMGSAEGYLAAVFALLAVPGGLFAASRIAADAADESAGRHVLLLSLPVSRRAQLAGHAAVLALGCTLLAALAGTAAWAGARIAGSGLGVAAGVGGALNTVPVMLVSLGAAVLAFGVLPRAVLAVGAVPAAGGFLLLVFSDTFGWPPAVRALSPYAHVAAVPVEAHDGAGAVGLLIVALLLTAAGVAAHGRRDVRA
ncbi:ABC-2 type transport system permease protein [Kineococcus xinjiangensis]|uniref:ABC-2 type transport system permease protein n=1 Tax=Kineococcus xinjiangensis TaxID=512762 RepID=A0A2S6IWL5_9ACTN|nr:polyketide antibiotic transporter [Kineococcus xinjiangensis]PPK98738.1 ABC-2 type transport system permease protein [Kineococcus xinjiangensis]